MKFIFTALFFILSLNILATQYSLKSGETLMFAQEKTGEKNRGRLKIIFSGHTDLRMVNSSKLVSPFESNASSTAGPGLYRFGGKSKGTNDPGSSRSQELTIGRLNPILEVTRKNKMVFRLSLAFNQDVGGISGNQKWGVQEVFLTDTWSLGSYFFLNMKGGLIFTPISLENNNTGWSSPYSLTPSAINTWVGEELRMKSLQLTIRKKFPKLHMDFIGSLFSGGDSMGSVLTWRGWSLHDRLPIYGSKILLRSQPWGLTGGATDPFEETDGRLGFYSGLNFNYLNIVKFSYLYLDSNGDRFIRDELSNNWSWESKFHSFALKVGPFKNIEILAQYMIGEGLSATNTNMGGAKIDNDYEASYVLASYLHNKWRFSLRYDTFEVKDNDTLITDKNEQKGESWLLATSYKLTSRSEIMLEFMEGKSKRAGNDNLPTGEVSSNQTQMAYRMTF